MESRCVLALPKSLIKIFIFRRKAGTDESDNVVSDLVQAFLIPEVERETTREKGKIYR